MLLKLQKNLLLVFLPLLVVFSGLMIAQQFVFAQDPYLHHAFVCTSIFVLSAYYADTFDTNWIIKSAVAFALFGMSLGVLEIIALMVSPAAGMPYICSSLI